MGILIANIAAAYITVGLIIAGMSWTGIIRQLDNPEKTTAFKEIATEYNTLPKQTKMVLSIIFCWFPVVVLVYLSSKIQQN